MPEDSTRKTDAPATLAEDGSPDDYAGLRRATACRLGDYYGCVMLVWDGAAWRMRLRDYGRFNSVKVSDGFAAAWLSEFPVAPDLCLNSKCVDGYVLDEDGYPEICSECDRWEHT